MISYCDRILQAKHQSAAISLVNEFLAALRRSPLIRQIPTAFRPHRVQSISEVAAWKNLVTAKLAERTMPDSEIVDPFFALHAVLEAAEERLLSLDATLVCSTDKAA